MKRSMLSFAVKNTKKMKMKTPRKLVKGSKKAKDGHYQKAISDNKSQVLQQWRRKERGSSG